MNVGKSSLLQVFLDVVDLTLGRRNTRGKHLPVLPLSGISVRTLVRNLVNGRNVGKIFSM